MAVVIVTYNNSGDLGVVLESLQGLEGIKPSILVVDNCSNTQELSIIRELETDFDFELVCNPRNEGFAAGNNKGISRALALGVDFIWLLNADTEVNQDTLLQLLQASSSFPDIDCWGSKIFQGGTQAAPRIWSMGGTVDFDTKEVGMTSYGELDSECLCQKEQPYHCDYIPGCSMFFASSLISKVGLMPEDFFMYFEETAWCNTMREHGLRLAVFPPSIIWHNFEVNKLDSQFNVYYYNRNQHFFWSDSMNWGGKFFYKVKFFFSNIPTILWALFKSKRVEDRKTFQTHLRAGVDFLLGRRGKRH